MKEKWYYSIKNWFAIIGVISVVSMVSWFIMNTPPIKQESWQTLECWNETNCYQIVWGIKFDNECFERCMLDYPIEEQTVDNTEKCSLECTEPQQFCQKSYQTEVCKEGRECYALAINQYPLGVETMFWCEECRNSLTHEKTSCDKK